VRRLVAAFASGPESNLPRIGGRLGSLYHGED